MNDEARNLRGGFMKFSLLVLILASIIATASAQTAPANMDSLMSAFWQRIVQIQKTEHEFPELAVPVDTGATMSKLDGEISRRLESCTAVSQSLQSDTTILAHDFERVALALPNGLLRLRVLLAQQRVEYLSLYLRCHPADSSAWTDFSAARDYFEHLARTAMLAD
jgi:hypothetical protein